MKKFIMIVSFLTLVFFIICTCLYLIANPKRPPSPADKVVMYKPKISAVTPVMKAFLRKKLDPALKNQVAKLYTHVIHRKWFADPEKTSVTITKLETGLFPNKDFLAKKTCLPISLSMKKQVLYLNLINYYKLSILRSIALTQQGKPDVAADKMLALNKSLLHLDQECNHNLISLMIITAIKGISEAGLDFVFAHPKLSIKKKQELFHRVNQWSSRKKDPFQSAWRNEYQFLLDTTKDLFKPGKTRTAGRKGSSVFGKKLAGIFTIPPFYDKAHTQQLLKSHYQHMIYRHSLANWLEGRKLTKTKTELFEEAQTKRNWQRYFRYNYVGRALQQVARPALKRFFNKWLQGFCLSQAKQTQWLRYLKKHKLSYPPNQREGINPSTKKPFGSLSKGICQPPLSAVKLTPMPSPLKEATVKNPSTK